MADKGPDDSGAASNGASGAETDYDLALATHRASSCRTRAVTGMHVDCGP